MKQGSKSLFYAYPSEPSEIGETVEAAVVTFRRSGFVDVKTWRDLKVTGQTIIDQITAAIDAADICAYDLTTLNQNVLFEFGYAIGKGKRTWISLNTGFRDAVPEYKKLGSTLIPIAYSAYVNHQDLEQGFFGDMPWAQTETPSIPVTPGQHMRVLRPTILYLKSIVETEASLRISSHLDASGQFAKPILDDPKEVPTQPLTWYVDSMARADAVVAHLLSERYVNAAAHNAKCALVCGLAHGLGKYILMLADDSFESAVDYRLLLRQYRTAKFCEKLLSQWMTETYDTVAPRLSNVVAHESAKEAAASLRHLSVGEGVAENEGDDIDAYFIETAAYLDVLEGRHTLFVGRKGTGKTANLQRAASQLREDARNCVCVIKPIGYEMDGLVRMLAQAIPTSERGYLIESLWKFLIYTELASTVLNLPRTSQKWPSATTNGASVASLKLYNLISPPFSVRLEAAVDRLCHVGPKWLARHNEPR